VIPRISVLCSLALLAASGIFGHELGAIRTFVAFHKDGSFAVELRRGS
jgi:hypothetical protein